MQEIIGHYFPPLLQLASNNGQSLMVNTKREETNPSLGKDLSW